MTRARFFRLISHNISADINKKANAVPISESGERALRLRAGYKISGRGSEIPARLP